MFKWNLGFYIYLYYKNGSRWCFGNVWKSRQKWLRMIFAAQVGGSPNSKGMVPSDVCWFINPINQLSPLTSLLYLHKPQNSVTSLRQLNAATNQNPILYPRSSQSSHAAGICFSHESSLGHILSIYMCIRGPTCTEKNHSMYKSE